jgi:sugar phosphate permease
MSPAPRRFVWHYAYVVVGITFLVLLFGATTRAIPSVIITPLEAEYEWDRATISFAVAISLFAFGFGAPIAGMLVQRIGVRRVMLIGLALIVVGLLLMIGMQDYAAFFILWAVVIGVGTGVIANVLGATIATRWFVKHRGLVVGALGAAAAMGQAILLPEMIRWTSVYGWRAMIFFMAVGIGALILPTLILMREQPSDVGARPVGDSAPPLNVIERGLGGEVKVHRTTLREAMRTRDFWLLAGSFFICGYTTNGLIGTHLLPHTIEHGFIEVQTAEALRLMGLMNIVGTLVSGWLSDRYDNRKLLALYYGLRGLSLLALPFIIELRGLLLFSVIYGLDWIATVPPTVNLTAQRFGRESLGVIYGWIFCAHMIGAGVAAQAGGLFRDWLGDYHLIFISAAVMGMMASLITLRISIKPVRRAAAVTS